MATLSDTTKTTRKVLIGVIIFIAVVVILNMLGKAITYRPRALASNFIIASRSFGDLPDIKFESLKLAEGSTPRFGLETTNGRLPTELPLIVNVFKYNSPRQTLTSRDESIRLANELGFTKAPEEISSTDLKWTSVDNTKSLNINKLTKTISLQTDLSKTTDIRMLKAFTSNIDPYASSAKSTLISKQLLNPNYLNAKISAQYVTMNEGGKYEKAVSPNRTALVLIDLYKQLEAVSVEIPEGAGSDQKALLQKGIVMADVLGKTPTSTNVNLVMGADINKQLYFLNVINWEVDTVNTGTYDLIPVTEAWNRVQAGEGSLVQLKKSDDNIVNADYTPLDVSDFLVFDVKLAYYETPEFQEYLQPIYMFTGEARFKDGSKGNFAIYFDALSR